LETEDIYKLGDFFLTLLQSYPRDLFYREIRKDSYYTKDPCYLKVNGSYLDKIRKNIIIDPKTLPMICQPRE
jgi:hypothetical protein